MASPSGTAIFYVFLIAPGFVAVVTATTLAAVEREHSRFTLLVWSLVLSIVIDGISIFTYQSLMEPIRSLDQMHSLLFNPGIQVLYIFLVLALSLVIGTIGAGFILFSVTDRARQLLQSKADIVVNPRQPWANFIRETGWVRVKTADDATFAGLVSEWSRANRQKELRVEKPHILNVEDGQEEFVLVGGKSMLFLEKDIDRVVMLTEDERPSIRERIGLTGDEENDSNEDERESRGDEGEEASSETTSEGENDSDDEREFTAEDES